MPQIISENQYWKLSYHEETNILKTNWKGVLLTDEVFRETMLVILGALERYRPQAFLANTLLFDYTITPDMQTWHNDTLFPVFDRVGMKKMAIVVSQDLFSQVSIEQAYGDSPYAFLTRYFASEEDAYQWIIFNS